MLDELSLYFDVMSRCIHEHGGAVDKFIGNTVMALWSAPMNNPDHALAACRAVLQCRAASVQLNAEFAARGHDPVVTHFGLHSGEVVIGNVGSADRMQYTAPAAEVNVASRVEGLNKHYGTQIIATGAVEKRARQRFLFRPLDLVVPAGTSQVVPLFELVGALDDQGGAPAAVREACVQWRQAIESYRRRHWREAGARFLPNAMPRIAWHLFMPSVAPDFSPPRRRTRCSSLSGVVP